MSENSNRFVLKNVVINYPNLFRAKAYKDYPARYSACLLIGRDDLENLNAYQSALEAAYAEGREKLSRGGELPELYALRSPLKDGELEKPGDPVYENRFYLNAAGKYMPRVLGRDLRPVTDENAVTPGCIVNASLTLNAYAFPDGDTGEIRKGISCTLNAVQLVRRGVLEEGGPAVNGEFTVLEGDENDLPF